MIITKEDSSCLNKHIPLGESDNKARNQQTKPYTGATRRISVVV